MGWVDDNNVVHLIETWHLGRKGINYADEDIWKTFIDNGIPIHMMNHGLYIYDPLPINRIGKSVFLFFTVLALPFLLLFNPRSVLQSLKNFNPFIRWNRLGGLRKIAILLPHFKNASVGNFLLAGKKYGVRWCFVEELADYFVKYDGFKLLDYKITENYIHHINFHLNDSVDIPIVFHSPKEIVSVYLDGVIVSADKEKIILETSNLNKGNHNLSIFTQNLSTPSGGS